jgi:hypothetical protein
MFSPFRNRLLTATCFFALLPAVQVAAHSQTSAPRLFTPPTPPFTAEFRMTTVRTLANGTTITRETKSIEARDSQGRRFTENELESVGNNTNPPVNSTGMINDPVEGTNTRWQTLNHEAVITKYPPLEQRHGCWANDAGMGMVIYDPPPALAKAVAPPVSFGKVEDLGTAMIEGVEVHGRRITRTIPAGTIGNDQPIVATNETWSAASLGGLTLKSVNDDPRSGKTTREVVHLDVGEPDPALFQPPSGYQLKIQELHQTPCDQPSH